MTIQEWISENRYADSIPRRLAALSSKFAIEAGVIGFASIAFAFTIDTFVLIGEIRVSNLPETWQSLAIALFLIGIRLGWCWTTDLPQGEKPR